MRMTLLEIVSDILNDMDGDEVNSIDDTVESQQVAQIVKSTYFALMSNRNWPHLRRMISLEASGNPAYPTHMRLADKVKELCFVNYNKVKLNDPRKSYRPVKWIEPDDFIRMGNGRNNTDAHVDIITDYSGIELFIRNDQAPQYFTSFDDEHLVFDSYDSEVDDTLQESKVQAMAYVMPEWTHEDDAYPDLPDEAFTLLLEEAKSRSSLKLKQTQDAKAEQEAGRQNRWLSRKAWKVEGGIEYPNYGRGRAYHKDPTFRNR